MFIGALVIVCSNSYQAALLRASGFRARRIDGDDCGLFLIDAPLGQTAVRVGRVSVGRLYVEVFV